MLSPLRDLKGCRDGMVNPPDGRDHESNATALPDMEPGPVILPLRAVFIAYLPFRRQPGGSVSARTCLATGSHSYDDLLNGGLLNRR